MDPTALKIKTVIRCADIGRSRMFYEILLGLNVVEEWEEREGAGCIFGIGGNGGGGLLEVYEMNDADTRFDEAFTRPVASDKIDIQLSTLSLEPWLSRLAGKWDVTGPETMPWGETRLSLRDPDGVLVVLVEENGGVGGG